MSYQREASSLSRLGKPVCSNSRELKDRDAGATMGKNLTIFMGSDTDSANFTSDSSSSADDEASSYSTANDIYVVCIRRNGKDESSIGEKQSAENSRQSPDIVERSEQSDSELESATDLRAKEKNAMDQELRSSLNQLKAEYQKTLVRLWTTGRLW